jgi:polyphosphate kinase 2 (PPK2 family)
LILPEPPGASVRFDLGFRAAKLQRRGYTFVSLTSCSALDNSRKNTRIKHSAAILRSEQELAMSQTDGQLNELDHHGETEQPKFKRKEYEKILRKLQEELCSLQEWVKAIGQRIIVVFEGRDAAGKGGTIKATTERVSPRTFRLVALPAPSDREKSQMYVQRYLAHFPAAGEIVIFDRSWYNRAGVEYVMGFCTKDQLMTTTTITTEACAS